MSSSSTIDKLQQEENNDPCVQMTDVTIETNIDPHDETTTTTTTVHLPFQIAKQCPPPKVISWMKSRKPATTATTTIRSKKSAQQSTRPHQHHHHNSSRHNRTVGKVQQLLPFLNNKRRNTTENTKKGDQAITVFSIQVNILGKVLVPPTPQSQSTAPTASSTSPQMADSSSSNGSSSSISELSEDSASAADLTPVKTLPAQLHRSATTSYVIHRTFEDFQWLSEMVLNLQAALMTAPGPIPEGPELKALAVRHPHPGLYQALLKQVSHAKANQRAFDASSTTHGFNEEGAFERILELNQYLEDVWHWLLPENTPESLNLSLERHDIMQWLKPSASSSHADGRQMRERSDQPSNPTATAHTLQIASAITAPAPSDAVESDLDAMALSTTSLCNSLVHDLSVLREEQLQEAENREDHDQQDQHTAKRAPERMSSVSSLPSLSSSTSAFSSTASMSTMSEIVDSNEPREQHRQQKDKLHQPIVDGNSDGHHLEVVMQGSPQTLSTMASSTLAASSDVQDPLDHRGHDHDLQHSDNNTPSSADAIINDTPPNSTVTIDIPGALAELPSFSRHGTLLRRHHRDSRLGSDDVKLKRRMSFSQVFKSLTMPISNNNINHHRHSQYDASTSGSMFDEEIYIWNTVTTKNLPSQPSLSKRTIQ